MVVASRCRIGVTTSSCVRAIRTVWALASSATIPSSPVWPPTRTAVTCLAPWGSWEASCSRRATCRCSLGWSTTAWIRRRRWTSPDSASRAWTPPSDPRVLRTPCCCSRRGCRRRCRPSLRTASATRASRCPLGTDLCSAKGRSSAATPSVASTSAARSPGRMARCSPGEGHRGARSPGPRKCERKREHKREHDNGTSHIIFLEGR
mmetsp:Transcript_153948/g.492153  ORF Transcript_153948/g.492153 Transcript_153948/m.492153 type:complete len:206 (-) Transcript_153948:16-633(-)